MNIKILTNFIFFLGFISINQVNAQLSITTMARTSKVKTGQNADFLIENIDGGSVNFNIKYATNTSFSTLTSGSVSSSSNRATVTYNTNDPGYYRCYATNGSTVSKVVAINPLSIEPAESEPADFDTYWNNQKTALAAVPLNATLSPNSSTNYADVYNFNVDITDGRKAYGYLSVPKNLGASKVPAIIELPAFGNVANIVNTNATMAERGGVIYIYLNIHNNVPTEAGPSNYVITDITDPNNYYMKYAIQGVMKTIDYLQTSRSSIDFNGQVGVTGISQGAGLAVLAAGIDNRISLLMSLYPAFCEHNAAKYGKPSGFPNFYINQGTSAMPTVQYYDAVYAAKRFVGNSWISVAYNDELSYPATVVAAFNQIPGKKMLQHELNRNHTQGSDEFFNSELPLSVYAFIRQHFPAAKAPWPYNPSTTAYDIDAGNDISNNNVANLPLNGTVIYNGSVNTTIPVYWEKISGPGNVSFSNSTSRTPTVNFTQSGTYRLRFVAEDTAALASDQKYFQIVDELTITTNAAVLPIEWQQFEGKIVGQINLLNWQTANESQNKGFSIERSADALSWETLGFVASKGNKNSENYYAYTDNSPLTTAYYRIQQIDLSGNTSYSKTISLNRTHALSDIKIYPNPLQQNIFLSNIEANDNIEIYDLLGKVWLTTTQYESDTPLSISHLPSGIYTVLIKNQNKVVQKRIVKP